jgi:tripartite-type tricarboxylate transporter receptor subunit TctC
MRLRRRRLLQIAGASALAAAVRARAETYPARAVRLIVPFGPASGADIAARLFADRLAARWRQPVVVENGRAPTASWRSAHSWRRTTITCCW